jgi:hypothetical protein
MKAEGTFIPDNEYAQEAVEQLAGGYIRGVSVDLDDASMELSDDGDGNELATLTDGRISAATLVPIPAFAEAYVALGDWDMAQQVEALAADGCLPCLERARLAKEAAAAGQPVFAIEVDDRVTWSEGETVRSGLVTGIDGVGPDAMATVMPDDAEEAVQVPVADLTEEDDDTGDDADPAPFPPESAADTGQFAPGTKDGPGWITNPQDTQRLRNYWVHGEGAAKIRWGQPGDFNRCRTQLAKYITNPQWLAGTCSNLHKVALGVWPGQEGGENTAVRAQPFTIVASAGAPDGADDDPAGATYTPAPAEWFDNPDLAGPTPLQVTDDGRVFGHLATWGTCHIGISGTCTTAPRSASGYAYFTTGEYAATAGPGEKVRIPVGALTLGTGHAKLDVSAMATVEHYDNTGSAVAYVAAGEDDHGIWVAGTLAPNVAADKRVALQAATLSGDWRKVAGNLELVAALAVNVPGFPIPRTRTHSTDRGQVALAAAGVVQVAAETEVEAGDLTATVTSAVLAALDARDAQRRRLRAARRAITAATDELTERREHKVLAARDRLKDALGVGSAS